MVSAPGNANGVVVGRVVILGSVSDVTGHCHKSKRTCRASFIQSAQVGRGHELM